MPGAKQNQAKKTTSPIVRRIMNPTAEELEEVMGSIFACVMVHMNGMGDGWDTARFMEWKTFLVDELKKATEPEGWEHRGKVGFAWKTLECECRKSKIISITDGEEKDTGIMVEFVCRNIPREETRFNMRIVEARLKKKYGDEFNLACGRKCGNDGCDSIHTFPHVLGIRDGALMESLENLDKLEEIQKDHQKLKLQTNEQCDVITSQLAEIAALKAENEDMKSRVIDYEYILKENEEHTRQIEECELVPSENVLCSYDDVNDFIWGRLQDICHEEPDLCDHFDWNELIKDYKGVPELKKENEALKKEIEELKANQKKPRKPKATKILLECAPMPEINETGVKRFIVVAGGAAAVCADKPEE